MMIAEILLFLALGCLILACITDVVRFEIPDWISIAILVLAVGYGLTQPDFGWWSHLLAIVAMFVLGMLLFGTGVMGGGDVKLLVASSAWTGLSGLPPMLLGVALAGGLLAFLLLVVREGLRQANVPEERLPGMFRAGAPLPYALAITAGMLWWGWQAWPLA